MAQLVLHGELGKKFGREFNLSINSPIEGIRALSIMKPGFREYFAQGSYYVYLGSHKSKVNIDEATLNLHTNDIINIVPAVGGAKKKGAGKLLAGIAMIGIAFIPGLNVAAFGALNGILPSFVSGNMVSIMAAGTKGFMMMNGLSLALTGAAQMTAPKVGEQRDSSLFGGAPDSVEEGTPVPLVYGQYLAIGYPASFELTTGSNSYGGTGGSIGGGGTGGGGGGSTGGWNNIIEQYE